MVRSMRDGTYFQDLDRSACIVNLSCQYMSWNFYRKILNVLLQNLMSMENFEIYI